MLDADPHADAERTTSEAVICQYVRPLSRRRCAHRAKWIATGPYHDTLVCGIHKRAYTRVLPIGKAASRHA